MIACSCSCDFDTEGAFCRYRKSVREYRTCGECGAVIWPWEEHVVGLWWDCDTCGEYNDCDFDGCTERIEPTTTDYMCATCDRVVDQLLCGCWIVGRVWRDIADQNEMSVAECIGTGTT